MTEYKLYDSGVCVWKKVNPYLYLKPTLRYLRDNYPGCDLP